MSPGPLRSTRRQSSLRCASLFRSGTTARRQRSRQLPLPGPPPRRPCDAPAKNAPFVRAAGILDSAVHVRRTPDPHVEVIVVRKRPSRLLHRLRRADAERRWCADSLGVGEQASTKRRGVPGPRAAAGSETRTGALQIALLHSSSATSIESRAVSYSLSVYRCVTNE